MPQNMLTEPVNVDDGSELPELTDKQRGFVNGVLSGKTGSDAVRAATDTRGWSQEAIWAEATKLRQHPSVRLWLAAARKANLQTGSLTVDEHRAELARLREIALESGNIGAAVNAEISRGKASGLYVDRIADVTDQLDPLVTLNQIAQTSPELARDLAKQHNIPFPPANEHADTRH